MGKRISSRRYPGVFARDSLNGDRTFYLRFSVGGRRFEEKVGTKSEGYSWKLAAEILEQRVPKLRHKPEIQHRSKLPTWSVMAAAYLEWADANKRSAQKDRQRWEKHLAPRIGRRVCDPLDAPVFERLKREMQDNGYAPATIRQVVILASGIWRRCHGWGMVWGESPLSSVSPPKIDNSRERFLPPELIALLLKELKKESLRDYGLALISWCTGARAGELFALRWLDVDLSSKTITFRTTKSGKTRRVPLNEAAMKYFSSMERTAPSDLIWTGNTGKQIQQMNKTAFRSVVKRLFNQGVDDRRHRVVFHTIRHSFASRLVSEGVPLNVVQELLGHSSLAMVQRYAHLAPGAQRRAVELVG